VVSARLITTRSVLHTHPQLAEQLAGASFDLQAAVHWDDFLRLCDGMCHGVVLLDLDDAERSVGLRQLGISAHRLVALLADQFANSVVALVVLTGKDYSEVEDLVKKGVHALLDPRRDAEWCLDHIRTALHRKQTQLQAPSQPTTPERPRSRLLLPVPDGADVDVATQIEPAADVLPAYL
jgi:hypothetical protein